MKFNPYNKPIEPAKPQKPDPFKLVKEEPGQLVYCGEAVDLSGKYIIEFDDEFQAFVIPLKKVENEFYERQLEMYQRELVRHEKDLEKYKTDLKEWKAQKKIWDEKQKEESLTEKKKLFERLKKELGET